MSNSEKTGLPIPRRELAKALGLTHQAVTLLVKQDMPTHSIESAKAWYEALKTKPTDLNGAKLRKTLLEVERLELQNAQIKTELISRKAVEEQGMRIGSILAAEVQLIAADAAQFEGLDAVTVRERLSARLNMLLERFNQRLGGVCDAVASTE